MITNTQFFYTGLFIDLDELESHYTKEHLERMIAYPHITFAYKPDMIDETLFGKEVKIIVNGYGINDENEGYKVSIKTDDLAIKTMFEQIAIPHITLSVSKEGKPVNTKDLDFKEIEPFEVTATFGGYSKLGYPEYTIE